MSLRQIAGMAALVLTLTASDAFADIIILDDFYFPYRQAEKKRPPEFLRDLAYSPDGKTIVSAGKSGFLMWEVDKQLSPPRSLATAEAKGIGAGVTYSPDGKLLYTADAAGNVICWDVAKRQIVLRFPNVHATVERMTLSRDGSTLATTDGRCTAFWDARTGRLMHGVHPAATDPFGGYSQLGYRYSYKYFDPEFAAPPALNRFHLALSPDGRWFAAHGPGVPAAQQSEDTAMQVRTTDRIAQSRYAWPIGAVASLDFSADGKRWAVGYRNGAIEVIEANTLKVVRSLQGPADSLVRFSPDQSFLVAHHPENGILAVYDLKSGRKLWHHHQAPAWRSTALAFAPDGQHLATGDSDRHIRVYELATGNPLVQKFAFPPDAKKKDVVPLAAPADQADDALPPHARLRLGSPHLWYGAPLTAGFFLNGDKQVLLFTQGNDAPTIHDTTTGKLVGRLSALQREKPWRQHVILAPDKRHLLMTHDNHLVWWDLDKQRVVKEFRFPTGITALAMSRNGKRFAVACTAEPMCPQPIHVWEAGKDAMQSMEEHENTITYMAFSPDGKRLYSASPHQQVYAHNRHEQVQGRIIEWDLAARRPTRTHKHQAEQVALSSDGNTWAILPVSSPCYLFDWAQQKTIAEVGGVFQHRSVTFAFTPDGKALALGGSTHIISLWDVRTGKLIRRFDGKIEQGTAVLCFSDDGKRLATKELTANGEVAGSVRLWDVESGKEICVNPYHRGPVQCVAYSPDSRLIVSAGEDRRILWWNANTGALLSSPSGEGIAVGHESPVKYLRFSADGGRLASACDKHVLLWDVSTRKATARITFGNVMLLGIGMTADGSEVRTVHVDGGIRTWDVTSGKLKVEFYTDGKPSPENPQHPLLAADFSPDGAQVAGVKTSGFEIALWRASSQKLVRNFTIAPPTNSHQTCSSLAFSPDGRYLAGVINHNNFNFGRWRHDFSAPKASVFVFEIAGGQKALTIRDAGFNLGALAFSPDGHALLHGVRPGVYSSPYGTNDFYNLTRHQNGESAVLRDLSAGAELTQFVGTGPARICAATGWELPQLDGILRFAGSAAFSPDGRSIATFEQDRTLRIWDAKELLPRKSSANVKLEAAEFAEAWTGLGQLDAVAAQAAIWRMTRDPQGAVSFLKSQLRAPETPDAARLQTLITALDSGHFATRAHAMRQLQGYAELAEPALRQALVGETRWERKRRLENLLLQIGDEMHSSWLQQKRGIEVLEKLDDPGAAALLEELSRGHPNARLTEDAHASLERWRRTK